MSAPVIAITGRRLLGGAIADMDSRYHDLGVDLYFSDYARCLAALGALPVLLPYEVDAKAIIGRVDGLLITGGQDLHPDSWGGREHVDPHRSPERGGPSAYDPRRDEYEIGLIRAALDRNIPLLGVCRGHQALNVALGGTLIPDLPAGGRIEHYMPESAPHRGVPAHRIILVKNSLAARVLGSDVIRNSWHHQAVAECGSGLVVSGHAADGVAEVLEYPGRAVLGVQWHPEWQIDPDPVLGWLVDTAAHHAGQRSVSTHHHLEGATQR